MKKLLNTLYVTTEDAYLTLDGENIVVRLQKDEMARFPLHTLEGIICFSYAGASPALMGACADRDIALSFCTPRGRFLARCAGESNGNVLLRRTQYRMADDPLQSCMIARNIIFGKVHNARWSIERTLRDHSLRVDSPRLERVSEKLRSTLPTIRQCNNLETLRGLEGETAAAYFGILDEMLLANKETFYFRERSRRPPLDPLNTMLSFVYTILANDCASALEATGLDAYVGFLHRDRPGRSSLALDLMEELRAPLADRFVITLVNNRQMLAEDFEERETGAVIFTDGGKKKLLKAWQERKKEVITHPYLKEKMAWGLVPYAQALLMARFIRRDMDGYPPFLWK